MKEENLYLYKFFIFFRLDPPASHLSLYISSGFYSVPLSVVAFSKKLHCSSITCKQMLMTNMSQTCLWKHQDRAASVFLFGMKWQPLLPLR